MFNKKIKSVNTEIYMIYSHFHLITRASQILAFLLKRISLFCCYKSLSIQNPINLLLSQLPVVPKSVPSSKESLSTCVYYSKLHYTPIVSIWVVYKLSMILELKQEVKQEGHMYKWSIKPSWVCNQKKTTSIG